ncbi:EAL domain-containing protein [Modestobacter sp. SYSU DS0511]
MTAVTSSVPDVRAGAAPDGGWAAALAAVLADPAQPALVFQPIVDLRRGVVAGYEALSRFPAAPGIGPDRWFAMADELGLGARLEGRVVAAALRAREDLPEGCFLSVNVSPHLLTEPEVADGLLSAPDLGRLVLELTEHVPVGDHQRLTALLSRLRVAGAAIALDDAGSGYSGLQQLALLRPQFVKLDRALVDHADRDEAKLALAELLGTYAGRLDAWLLVEGIERPEELAAFVRLGVPLAQGYLLARPAPGWSQVDPGVAELLRNDGRAGAPGRHDRLSGRDGALGGRRRPGRRPRGGAGGRPRRGPGTVRRRRRPGRAGDRRLAGLPHAPGPAGDAGRRRPG